MTTEMQTVTAVLEPMQQGMNIECCDEARVCAICGSVTCFEHSDPSPVTCEVNGTTCGNCHREECTSMWCARELADPDE